MPNSTSVIHKDPEPHVYGGDTGSPTSHYSSGLADIRDQPDAREHNSFNTTVLKRSEECTTCGTPNKPL